MRVQTTLAAALLACSSVPGQEAPHRAGPAQEAPRELGQVPFSRDLEAALVRAKGEGKPVFLLFQEVPGCATCVRFGEGPLSHPLLVEAIEQLFVPVAIYNNRGGADASVLRRYSEPAWNNPIVRFLDGDGVDLIERRGEVWSTAGIVARMAAALETHGTQLPPWFSLLAQELDPKPKASAVFAMSCFWSGEAKLGGLDGVVDTRAGWHAGREVVEVTYQPARLAWQDLHRAAQRAHCASTVWLPGNVPSTEGVEALEGTVRDAKPSDQLYYLAHSPLRRLPLTPLQARRVNSALATGQSVESWLSPRQVWIAKRIQQLGPRAETLLADWTRPTEHSALAGYTRDLERELGL